ncbi:MAG: hypothetical protein L7S72_09085, partial [Flavobacteriales bacterium]|nr:hypothetical protein [Flavobacteriales bacterium]
FQGDQYRFGLEVSENFEIKNNIVNPKIYGFIDSNDNKDGNIVLRLSKDSGNTFLSEFSHENGQNHSIAPHNDITLTALTKEGNTPSFYGEIVGENTIGSDFSVYQDINSNNDANIHFKKEMSSYFQTDTIKLRVNRFARSDFNYTLNYTHPLNVASGIFETQNGSIHHGVLPMTSAITLKNYLQPIVIDTVSEVKVYYPSSKPQSGATWSNNEYITNSENSQNTAYQYNSYAAYFYVDVTFKNANTNQPVYITAKYDTEGASLFGYQQSGGHKLHHGLILNYDENEIPEEITQTTIRDSNNNVVDLLSGVNGTKLRIEFPAGDTQGGIKNAYNTSNNEPSSYGFTNPTKTLKITFDDRQEKNFDGSNSTDYYYINLMDSNGNVCLPFDKTVSFPNNLGIDNTGKTPKIVSAVVNATYTEGSWSDKQLVLTFAQDIYDNGLSPLTFSLSKDINLKIKTPLTLTTPEGSVSEKTVTLNCPSVKITDVMTVDYSKPIGGQIDSNTGLYDNILYNWFGFEINNFSDFSVTNSLNEIPTVTNIVFTNGTLNIDDYEGTLSWSVNGTDSDKVVEYTIEKASTFNATTWSSEGTSTTTSLSVTGLAYENDVYYRIKAKTYDYGEYKVSSLVRQDLDEEEEEEFSILSLTNKSTETLSVPVISISWEAITGATQYQVQFSTSSSFATVYGTKLYT